MAQKKVLIVGCGYVGLPLALEFQSAGDEVSAWVRSTESASLLAPYGFHRIVTGSVGDPAVWSEFKMSFDLVVHAASSGGGGTVAYEEVFLDGARNMNRFQAQARRLLISSTSVYGQTSGEVVTEESPADPASAPGKVLRAAEQEALAGGALGVRSSGIYGPGRGVLFDKFARGEAVMEGHGTRWLNQVHQRDLVAAIQFLLEKGTAGEIYNATDDEPVQLRDFYQWCAQHLKRPMPPSGPVDPHRKRGLTSKRVSNAKLRKLGWQLQFPTFREGFSRGR